MVPEYENEKMRELIRINFRIVYYIVDPFRIDILTIHRCERMIDNTYDFSDKLID